MRKLLILVVLWCVFLLTALPALAADVLGVHILNTGELGDAAKLLKSDKNKDAWDYVTIPFTLDDVSQKEAWARFFSEARALKFQPIVRLATRFADGAWQVPSRKDIVEMVRTLSSLEWPQDGERLIVVFNEPNHAKEWGGRIDPQSYVDMLQFTAEWLHGEGKNYVVLPAGMDLAAPSGKETLEAFTFWRAALARQPEVLEALDGWTSHSYPNPAFSSSPVLFGKNTLRGFQDELAFLRQFSAKTFPVYITETGWAESKATARWLPQYYRYAVDMVWSDPRVRAVTPFVLRGDPGAFSAFSFLDRNGKPTKQFDAFQKAMEK